MNFDLEKMFSIFPAVVIGLTIHEWAHAYTAYKLGDTTAKDQGRLTLNPLKHLDPFGTLLILILGFGWAKPVQFNPDNLKQKHRDEILISIAGPLSNFLLGIAFLALARGIFSFADAQNANSIFGYINTLVLWAIINFGLAIFNMIPLPPLDGSHLYMTFFSRINPTLANRMYSLGMFVLIGILLMQNFLGNEILPIGTYVNQLTDYFLRLLGFQL
ncbi:site-2 protease family protein [Undibacterium sp. LX40W]|uniref:Site-2 protease family protein n=1 Tax=Undibacterium nitidum TaxID=2762298 RepID=A0A923HVK1_9BURK|nr:MULTISPECIES: site-2 protease family protein [Undibacterium]MBC3880901.1 site-2 protease family protein [Undibacterium nitidum]MBC3890366.1 site-2 protease family protein [Undibacterium sp. LX40W]